jgi:hypothetical protein
MSYKDMWIDECDELAAELIDAGMDEDEALELAAERAGDRLMDRLADHADNLRTRAKEQGGQ